MSADFAMSFNKDTKDGAWLSVIVPTYNGEQKIADALSSVSAQNDSDVEVIVVDDGSTDSTLDVAKSFSDSLRLKVFEHEHKGNWVSSTNYGILNSSGEYICFLHQDDRWENGRLAAIRDILTFNPDVAMCFHPSWFIEPDGRRLRQWGCPFRVENDMEIISCDIILKRLLVQNFIAISSPVFRKDNAIEVGLLDESLIYTADWDFWLKMSHFGPIAYIPRPLTCFMVHPESQTESLSSNADDVEQQLSCVLERHFDRYRASVKDKQRLWRIASFSVRLNVALMKLNSGQRVHWIRLIGRFLSLGMTGWYRFLLYSRIIDRVFARIQVKFRYKDS